MDRVRGNQLAQALIEHAGLGKWSASRAMGRAGQYVDTLIRRGNVPSVDVAADLADVCGFDLCAINRETGERLTIDPPAGRRAG